MARKARESGSPKRVASREKRVAEERATWHVGDSSAARAGAALDKNVSAAMGRVLALTQTPARAALVARALNGLADLTPELSDEAVAHAIGARSDAGVLAHVLEEAPAITVLKRDDPLAAARLRGLRAKAELLEAEGGTWSAEHAAKHLRLTRQAVDNRRKSGKLIGLDLGRRGFAYPVWQFAPNGVLPGLEAVLAAMTVRAPWDQLVFFVSGDPRLGGERPLDVLRRGRAEQLEDVKRAARGYGEHSAA